MLALRDAVLAEWEARVRACVTEAAALAHPILINTFPAFYDNIAEAVTPDSSQSPASTTTVAAEHGGERARLTDYNPQAVIAEYQLLRWSILDVLEQHGVSLTRGESFVINSYIDAAIRESVNTFAITQLALREQFVSALAHDLRNPLATASAAAELIRHTTDAQKMKNLAGRISANLGRVDRMIQDLLDAVVFHSGERLRLQVSKFDMMEVVNEVAEQFTAVHGPRLQVRAGRAEGWWDRKAMHRALENLIGNAMKYGDAGAPILVTVDAQQGRVLLSVHNEGAPIPAGQAEIVFQVFRRAEGAHEDGKQGWGIGLSYVRSVAESHGGSVGIDSAAGRGTTFTIDVPIDARPYEDAPTLGGRT